MMECVSGCGVEFAGLKRIRIGRQRFMKAHDSSSS